MERAETVERVQSLLAAWNRRNLDTFVALMHPDVYWHDLGMPTPPAIGREAVRRFSESILRAFPDFRYTIRGSVCVAEDGESCVVPWTINATHTAPFDPPGFAPVGRAVQFDGLDYLEFRDGLVARIETRFDPVDPIEQLLGVRIRPPAGSFLERALVGAQRVVAWWLRKRSKLSAG